MGGGVGRGEEAELLQPSNTERGCSKCRYSRSGCGTCHATTSLPSPMLATKQQLEEDLPQGWSEVARVTPTGRKYKSYHCVDGRTAQSRPDAHRKAKLAPPPSIIAHVAVDGGGALSFDMSRPLAAGAGADKASRAGVVWADGVRGTGYELKHGCCFDALSKVGTGFVAATIIDPPYGTL